MSRKDPREQYIRIAGLLSGGALTTGVALVVFAALEIHRPRGFEHILGIQAAEHVIFENLIH
jgi:translation initiation factor 2 gamma subunit (eIF-2gamma)